MLCLITVENHYQCQHIRFGEDDI